MPKLIIAGSGIKTVSHLTEETVKVIQGVDKVLYLVMENNLKTWVTREAKDSESLDGIYFSNDKRIDSYHQITQHIINEYYKVKSLCVLFYGHPILFAESALKAANIINNEGGEVIILPAISSIDCLISDLQIDPSNQGYYCVDATELLIYEKHINITSHLIIWQGGNLGSYDVNPSNKLDVLCGYLEGYYHNSQAVCVYEASTYPLQKPRIEWTDLNKLPSIQINPQSTLYIPPSKTPFLSKKYLSLLNMNIENFKLSADLDTSSK
jgi:uncharacterized protein YabN with tetrapyrrole methylase and pyrophosphatase domain